MELLTFLQKYERTIGASVCCIIQYLSQLSHTLLHRQADLCQIMLDFDTQHSFKRLLLPELFPGIDYVCMGRGNGLMIILNFDSCLLDKRSIRHMFTVNQLNLTAVKFSFLKSQTYLAKENLAFECRIQKNTFKNSKKWNFSTPPQTVTTKETCSLISLRNTEDFGR